MSIKRILEKRIQEYDAFPKIDSTYQTKTTSGGFLTLLVVALLLYLLKFEIYNYFNVHQKYEFLVDNIDVANGNNNPKININVDITIATRCEYLTVDVVDAGDTAMHVKRFFDVHSTKFDSDRYRAMKNKISSPQDEAVHEIIRLAQDLNHWAPIQEEASESGCRLNGTVEVNKVTGNLHFLVLGHGHAGPHVPHEEINFSHVIHKMSFGVEYPNLVNPLDNTVETTDITFYSYKYFVSVIPTIYIDYNNNVLLTNQYAVTDYSRAINLNGDTVLPGIFFSYDIEPIRIRISEQRPPFTNFLVRVCGIVGGVWVSMGMLYSIFHFLYLGIRSKLS